MRIETLTVGDELLDGRVTDTNTVRLAQALNGVGMHISQRTSITDDISIIVREAQAVAARGAGLCVVSGGLGPTTDDLTSAAFAALLGVPLVRDRQEQSRLEAMLTRRGRQISESQLRQADRPQGAELIANPVGTAPGFAVTWQGCRFVSLPGVPKEFDAMVQTAVLPPLQVNSAPILRRALYCFGLLEADADKRLGEFAERFPTVRLQYRVKFPEVHVTMHAPPTQQKSLDAAFAWAQAQLSPHAYATHEQGEGLAACVIELLRRRAETMAAGESCTGGKVCDLLTDIDGCSKVFKAGVVAYHNETKINLLGVAPESLASHGAVSEEVVCEMAAGVQRLAHATYGVATSGIAGPGGGSPEKPVGTVWLAVAGPSGVRARKLSLPFDRVGNKGVSAFSVLDLLRQELSSRPMAPNA